MIYIMHVGKVTGINSEEHYLEAFEELDDALLSAEQAAKHVLGAKVPGVWSRGDDERGVSYELLIEGVRYVAVYGRTLRGGAMVLGR